MKKKIIIIGRGKYTLSGGGYIGSFRHTHTYTHKGTRGKEKSLWVLQLVFNNQHGEAEKRTGATWVTVIR